MPVAYYCLPDFEVAYEYGLKNSPATPASLKDSFGKRLILLLGQDDVDANHEFLNKSPEAMAQGENRLMRGRYFLQIAQKTAKEMKAKLNWKAVEVAEVGHSNSGMARELLDLIDTINKKKIMPATGARSARAGGQIWQEEMAAISAFQAP